MATSSYINWQKQYTDLAQRYGALEQRVLEQEKLYNELLTKYQELQESLKKNSKNSAKASSQGLNKPKRYSKSVSSGFIQRGEIRKE